MRVSVIIPCHNAARWIAQAIQSAAAQTHKPHEIIVIDDASTDNSVEVIKATGVDVRLLHVQERNAAAARNRGIETATGEWIAILDADDFWYPNHLSTALDVLGQHPGDVAYRALCDETDVDGRVFKVTKPQPLTGVHGGLSHAVYPELEAQELYFGHSTMLLRRDRMAEIGGYDASQVRRHDIDMWLRFIHGKTWAFDSRPTVAYRIDTPGSICRNLAACEYYYLRALRKNEPNYRGPAMDELIHKTAKRAMSLAFMNGSPRDFELAREISWPYLPATYRMAYRIADWCSTPLRAGIRAKRAWFTMRTGHALPSQQ